MQNTQTTLDALIAEILPKPSNQMVTKRFQIDAANCNGDCHDGTCDDGITC